MSLFGDLPESKTGTALSATPAWANPTMQPKLQPKKPNATTTTSFAPRMAGRGGRSGPGPVGPGRGAGRGAPSNPASTPGGGDTGSAQTTTTTAVVASTSTIFSSFSGHIKEEYDPMRPNEYEQVLKDRERRKKEADIEAERQAKIKELDAVVARLVKQDGGEGGIGGGEGLEEVKRDMALGISGEEAFLRRGMLSGKSGSGGGAGSEEESRSGMTKAQKMLEKMGWKEGDGLGKNLQGMQTPLVAQKTDRRAGVIVNAEPTATARFSSASASASSRASPSAELPDAKRPKAGAALVGKPSRVICLRNMVGPGEVDEDLEDEVGNELTKYGNVTSVMIFEVTTPGYEAEEAVRIFIQFDRVESATKAQIDLQV